MLDEIKVWGWAVVLLVNGFGYWLLWSLHKKFTTREDCGARHAKDNETTEALEQRYYTLETRVTRLESGIKNLPTAGQLHGLDLKITKLAGDQSTLAAEVRGTRDIVTRVEHMMNLLTESHIKE